MLYVILAFSQTLFIASLVVCIAISTETKHQSIVSKNFHQNDLVWKNQFCGTAGCEILSQNLNIHWVTGNWL